MDWWPFQKTGQFIQVYPSLDHGTYYVKLTQYALICPWMLAAGNPQGPGRRAPSAMPRGALNHPGSQKAIKNLLALWASTGILASNVGGENWLQCLAWIIEGSLEVKLPTILWTDGKSRGGKSQGRGRRERISRQKVQVREKSRNNVFFQCCAAPEAQKVGSLKWRAWSHLARWEMTNCTPGSQKPRNTSRTEQFWQWEGMSKQCTPLWNEAHMEVKMLKAHHSRTTFGSSDVQTRRCGANTFKSKNDKTRHSRATFGSRGAPSQNVQNTSARWKSARTCAAKHISKSKWYEHHFWTFRCRFAWQAQGNVHLV